MTIQRIEETKKYDRNEKMEIENSRNSPSEQKIVTVKCIAQVILQYSFIHCCSLYTRHSFNKKLY